MYKTWSILKRMGEISMVLIYMKGFNLILLATELVGLIVHLLFNNIMLIYVNIDCYILHFT